MKIATQFWPILKAAIFAWLVPVVLTIPAYAETSVSLVKDIAPGSGSSFLSFLTNVNGTLFFSANDGVNGRELWKATEDSDGDGVLDISDNCPPYL